MGICSLKQLEKLRGKNTRSVATKKNKSHFTPSQLFHKYMFFVAGGGLGGKYMNSLTKFILTLEKKENSLIRDPTQGQS